MRGDEYERKIKELIEKNTTLEAENSELKYKLHDVEVANRYMRDDIEREVAEECGCVVISNALCYQDFVGILLNNGYTVEIEPIEKEQSYKITIKERETHEY